MTVIQSADPAGDGATGAEPSMLDHALAWAARGFRIFPLVPGTKVPPKGFDWKAHSTSDPAVIRRVWGADEYGIGVRTDDLIVIDVDVKDGKDGATSFAMLELQDVVTTETLTVRTPSKGTHYYYRKDPIHGRLGMLDGIDVKAIGGYVVAPGTVLRSQETGEVIGTYELVADHPVAEAPPKLIKRILDRPGPKERSERREVEETPGNVERARQWLLEQAPTSGTFKVACKVRDFGVEDATCLDLMLDVWNDRRDVPREVDHIEFRVRNAYEYALNPAGVLSHEAEFGEVSLPEPEYKTNGAQAEPQVSQFRLLALEQLESEPARVPVVKGLLSRGDVGCIFGAPGAGKSVLAPYFALRVSQGQSAFGMRTRKGPVLYVAAEDQHGMGHRLRALRKAYGEAECLYLASGLAGLMNNPNAPELRDLVSAIRRHEFALIVIDTLAIAFPIDENASREMGEVVQTCRMLADLGPAVVLVHHNPKGDDSTPRGHSILNGALDVSLRVRSAAVAGIIRCECMKNRNGFPRTFGFKIRSEELGVDDDGDVITAPVCEEIDLRSLPKDSRLTAAQLSALDILDELAGADGRADLLAWRGKCITPGAISDAADESGRAKAFRRAKDHLVELKLIVVGEVEGREWVSRPPVDFSAGVTIPEFSV